MTLFLYIYFWRSVLFIAISLHLGGTQCKFLEEKNESPAFSASLFWSPITMSRDSIDRKLRERMNDI